MAETSANPSASEEKGWHSYTAEDLKRTVFESTDSALRSARSVQENSSLHFRAFQHFILQAKSQFITYEEAFFTKVKEELISAREHPVAVGGVAVVAGLLLMRGPRRFLFRHTLGRLQSEETRFLKTEKNVKELSMSVDLMKNESKKLLQRAALAEDEMKKGHAKLKDAGNEIQRLAKSVYKIESEAIDLMDGLRAIPGREAIKHRAEVASMASFLKQQRTSLNKKILKISELGISV